MSLLSSPTTSQWISFWAMPRMSLQSLKSSTEQNWRKEMELKITFKETGDLSRYKFLKSFMDEWIGRIKESKEPQSDGYKEVSLQTERFLDALNIPHVKGETFLQGLEKSPVAYEPQPIKPLV